ncbi:MAG: type II toxin-antitoxin system prevent-host-death family antitoxin [Methylovulum sp.]|nr:type II toxin-antitoxin system prevent-host-death family antitoxin [Methylovulum sp.]
MNALTFSYVRQNFADIMRAVNDDHAPVVVTHQNAKPVVIMSLEDYQSLEETAYLLRNSTGAQRLLESVAELRAGDGVVRELLHDD